MIASVMTSKDDPRDRRTDGTFLAVCALLSTMLACTVVLLASPRPVEPGDLPALHLDAAQATHQVEQDGELAARAPRGELVDRLLARYRQYGLDELAPHADGTRIARTREELAQLSTELASRSGPGALDALRAALLEQALRALRGELASADAHGLLGAFPVHLARNGFVAQDGSLRAPELAIRALYKARFNIVTGRAREASLSQIERQALEGYIALHAHQVPGPERMRAARDFYTARGRHGAEALATWLFAARADTAAQEVLARAESAPTLRIRNLRLYVERNP